MKSEHRTATTIYHHKYLLLLACCVSVSLRIRFLQNEKEASAITLVAPEETRMSDHAAMARTKGSSLRFDWTHLPPLSALAQEMDRVQKQCFNTTHSQQNPQEVSTTRMFYSGLGSTLHQWTQGLCHATLHNYAFVTIGEWEWNDKTACRTILNDYAKNMTNDRDIFRRSPNPSPLWCYFGSHESVQKCPEGTLDFTKVHEPKPSWGDYRCDNLTKPHGFSGVRAAAIEFLFQSVNPIVIEEAERQIREEAFPNRTDIPKDMITVHMRWGDKFKEMKLATVEEYVNATIQLLTDEEKSGAKPVHIYLATIDQFAIEAFEKHAKPNWIIHRSGPTNSKNDNFVLSKSFLDNGRSGLQCLASLLISMESNRFVLTRLSNWSRLIDELRKTVLDYRCGNCTQMIDLRPGEV